MKWQIKTAATRIGVSLEEYLHKTNNGFKHCYKCKQWLKINLFSKDKSRGDGLKANCKQCSYKPKTSNPGNRERKNKSQNNYFYCSSCKQWLNKKMFPKRKGKCIDCKNTYYRKRYQNNEAFREGIKQRNKARKRNIDPIPLNVQQSALDVFNNSCAYCGGNFESWDHIVPVSMGGESKIYNIVPCCISCNSSKNNKDLFEWAKQKDIFISEDVLETMFLEDILGACC